MGAKNNIAISVAVMSVVYWMLPTSPSSDYEYMCDSNHSENCFENPNTVQYMKKEASKLGLELEVYETQTEDGYIIPLCRIPPKWNPRGIIMLQHPYLSTSIFWLDKGTDSYAYTLHKAGYDVWITNVRGTTFSSHVNLTENDFEYWNFTFHEMGVYDTKTQVEFVADATNSTDIIFVGYSLGTTTALVYASHFPEEAEKYIKVFVAFNPTAFGVTVGKGLQTLLNWKFFEILRAISRYYKIGALSESSLIPIWKNSCKTPLGYEICKIAFAHLCGSSSTEFDPKFYPVLFAHHPATVALKTMFHYFQHWRGDGIFKQYDYGEEGNMIHYQSSTPPEYPINNITVPFYLIYGLHDDVGTHKDMEELYERLPEKVKIYGRKMVYNNHCDPFMSKSLHNIINQHSIEFLNRVAADKR